MLKIPERKLAAHVQAAIGVGQAKMGGAMELKSATHVQAAIGVGQAKMSATKVGPVPAGHVQAAIPVFQAKGIRRHSTKTTFSHVAQLMDNSKERAYVEPTKEQLKKAQKDTKKYNNKVEDYKEKFDKRSEYLSGRPGYSSEGYAYHGTNDKKVFDSIKLNGIQPKQLDWGLGGLDASKDGIISASPNLSLDYKYIFQIDLEKHNATWKKISEFEIVTYESIPVAALSYTADKGKTWVNLV